MAAVPASDSHGADSDASAPEGAARPPGQYRLATIFAAMALAAALFSCLHVLLTPPPTLEWQPWTKARLGDHQGAGRTVIVYFHARWDTGSAWVRRCVWQSRALVEELRQRQIVLLEVDFTDDNPAGEDFLDTTGQASLPLVVVFRPKAAPRCLRLNELSDEAVLQAIR